MQDVYLEAKRKKKKYYAIILAMLFGFLMLTLLTVLLDYLLPFSTIILFPFFILPYFIAMQMMLIQIDVQEFNNKTFYRLFRIGLSPLIKMSFGTLINVLLAILIYYLVNQVSIIVFVLLPQNSGLITQLIESMEIEGITFKEMYDIFYGFIQNSESWKQMIFISTSIAYGAGFMFFIYRMLHNSLYALCKTSASLPSGRNKPVFKEVFKKYSRYYYKTYYKHEWYKVALVPIFYAGGVLLAYYLNLQVLTLVIAPSLALVAVTLLLPNLLLYQEKTYVMMFHELSKKNYTNMQKVYTDLKGQANLNKEQEKALDEFMKQLENATKEKREENKENKNSDE
ncbi:MAG: hypothetical protein J1F31_03555 [Erysipelotrichales bacterium]|nr:hypothetical protein [Erysipelotrichales bacterium]